MTMKTAGKKKILIVEDEKSVQRAMQMKFEISDFDVTIGDNGLEALAEIAKKKFDVILMDLIMPIIDGYEVLEELKKRGDHTPVVILSNLSQENDIKKAKDLGAVAYLVKSDTPINKIVECVREAAGP